ncbi:hypothetical protein D3C87_280950 [compost metagenome]
MSKTFTRTYVIAQFPINVQFSNRVVSIDFTPYTQSEKLSLLYQHSEDLVQKIKAEYKDSFQKELKISNASFVAEIWGHIVAYKIALWMKKNINISPVQKFAKFAAFRSGVIDCGESKVDTNRWFWDILAPIFFRKYR